MSEPDSGISTVALTVTRTGSFGTATITWTISAVSSSPGASILDIGANAGQVVIPNGGNTNTFFFTARPDDTPEVEEQFLVTLITVTENNQMILSQDQQVTWWHGWGWACDVPQNSACMSVILSDGQDAIMEAGIGVVMVVDRGTGGKRDGCNVFTNSLLVQNEAVVTILANDDPSGVFSISNSTRGPFFLDEQNNRILVITIARSRGDLTRELISYELIGQPNEIAGGIGIADFQPGAREMDVTLFVTDDDTPETNETFLFRIRPLNAAVELLEPTTVDITVLANDDFAGVFSFNASSLITSIGEGVVCVVCSLLAPPSNCSTNIIWVLQ